MRRPVDDTLPRGDETDPVRRPEDEAPARSFVIGRPADDDLQARKWQADIERRMFGTSRPVRIGRYLVIDELGRGGMGVVYAAYDPQLDRKVAIKLLHSPTSGEGDGEAGERLVREARALARLDDANVVPIHDAGEFEGQVFLAMEFVDGRSLRSWQEGGGGPWDQALRIYLQAAQGLLAAHEQGIIHRDFKPDNVMLDDRGRARVMDFGLARTQAAEPVTAKRAERDDPPHSGPDDEVKLTQTGALLGTPAYMSPEQLDGRTVDARTDQFSFCVSVWEALYGRRPYPGDTLVGLAANLRAGRLVPPPTDSDVPTWVRKALERGLQVDREQRWPSLRELIDALDSHPDPAARRNARLMGGALVALGGVTAYGLATRPLPAAPCSGMDEKLAGVWDEARRDAVRDAFVGTGTSYAEETWRRVREELDQYAQAWVQARTGACEATRVTGEQSEALLDRRMACYDERLWALGSLTDVFVEADDAVLREALPAASRLPSLTRCADADALTAQVPPPEDPDAARAVTAGIRARTRVTALQSAGRYQEALVLAAEVTEDAERIGYEPLLAAAVYVQAVLHQILGDHDAAREGMIRAYSIAVEQGVWTVAADASNSLMSLIGYHQARPVDAQTWAVAAAAFARHDGDPVRRATNLRDQGRVELRRGAYAEALDLQRRALAMVEQEVGPEHLSVTFYLDALALTAKHAGDLDGAGAYMERSLAILESKVGPEHPQVVQPLSNLGTLAQRRGDWDTARGRYVRAAAIAGSAYGPDSEVSIAIEGNLAGLALEQGNYDEADRRFESVLAGFESRDPKHPRVALTLGNIGQLRCRQGDHEEAMQLLRRSLALLEERLGDHHHLVAKTISDMGWVRYRQGRFEQSLEQYERALAIYEQSDASESKLANPLLGRGRVLLELGKPSRALPVLERALSIQERTQAVPRARAEARFALGRARWETAASPSDRANARELVISASETFEREGAVKAESLDKAASWLEDHPANAE